MDKAGSQMVDGNTAESSLHSMLEQMESHAGSASWEDVEAIAVRLRRAIAELPAPVRRSALLEAQRRIDRIAANARSARRRLSDKLTGLSRGKAAKKAYELR